MSRDTSQTKFIHTAGGVVQYSPMAIQQPQHTSHQPQPRSWLLAWFFSPLIIPNEGSTARDHLTRDRTWMQWVTFPFLYLVYSTYQINHFLLPDSQIRLSSLLVVVSLVICVSFPGQSDDDDHHNERRDLEKFQNPVQSRFTLINWKTHSI